MSSVVRSKLPCPDCGSSDALAEYDDGHTFCYSCSAHHKGDGTTTETTAPKKGPPLIPFDRHEALRKRGIHEETCEKYGYFIATDDKGKTIQVAPYRNKKGQTVGQKVRRPNKEFYTTGDFSDVALFGQHLFRNGGKRILVVEGEIDALAGHQMLGTWPVVSIPNGAQGAVAAVKRNIEFLEGYDKVVFGFDMDEPGREAVVACAALLTPGKAAIMELPLKDAGEMLQERRAKEFASAFWEAREYRPDGIVTMSDLKERILAPIEIGLPWFLEDLTTWTYGRRLGETYALGAGTGVGKTDFLTQQVQYDVDVLGEKVGLFMLEQPPVETGKRVAGKFAGKRFHVPDGSWEADELVEVIERLERDDRIFMYDNFGATDWEVIKGVITYLAMSRGVRLFYLDHLTALAAAEENEKEALERIMADMALLAKRLQIVIHFVSHLSTPDGKPHEEGGRVMIRHFKGSRAIGFWSHGMIGLERDGQSEDEAVRSTTTLRILKDRYTGQSTGKLLYLGYDGERGLLYKTTPPEERSSAVDMLDDGEF